MFCCASMRPSKLGYRTRRDCALAFMSQVSQLWSCHRACCAGFNHNMLESIDVPCSIPIERWDVEHLDASSEAQQSNALRFAAFMTDPSQFDSQAFKMAPRRRSWSGPTKPHATRRSPLINAGNWISSDDQLQAVKLPMPHKVWSALAKLMKMIPVAIQFKKLSSGLSGCLNKRRRSFGNTTYSSPFLWLSCMVAYQLHHNGKRVYQHSTVAILGMESAHRNICNIYLHLCIYDTTL